MSKVLNSAPNDARCDVCGNPNRTGASVVYVQEEWCQQNSIPYSDGMKLCIWCRADATSYNRRHDGVVKMMESMASESLDQYYRGNPEKSEIPMRGREFTTTDPVGMLLLFSLLVLIAMTIGIAFVEALP